MDDQSAASRMLRGLVVGTLAKRDVRGSMLYNKRHSSTSNDSEQKSVSNEQEHKSWLITAAEEKSIALCQQIAPSSRLGRSLNFLC